MERKTVLVIADLGGCPPHMFYKSAAEKYNLVSFIPRPFAITASHAALIEKYSFFSSAFIKHVRRAASKISNDQYCFSLHM